MSVIEVLRPCGCGRCDAHQFAVIDAHNIHSDALEVIGIAPRAAAYVARAISLGGLFSFPRPERPQRWTA